MKREKNWKRHWKKALNARNYLHRNPFTALFASQVSLRTPACLLPYILIPINPTRQRPCGLPQQLERESHRPRHFRSGSSGPLHVHDTCSSFDWSCSVSAWWSARRSGLSSIILGPLVLPVLTIILVLPPQCLQPLLFGMCVDVCANDEANKVEERHPSLVGQERLREGECEWRCDP